MKFKMDAERAIISTGMVRYLLVALQRMLGAEVTKNAQWRTSRVQDDMINSMSQQIVSVSTGEEYPRTLAGIPLVIDNTMHDMRRLILETKDQTKVLIEVVNLGVPRLLSGMRLEHLTAVVNETIKEFGYEVSDTERQTLFPDYDNGGYLTGKYWFRVEPLRRDSNV